jgi:microcompartment protein CcmL/EutN
MMKKNPAIGVVEFSDIPTGMVATDAMLKRAPIGLIRSGTITAGRYLTLIGGTPASVDESLRAGLLAGGEYVLDHVFLADVHAQLYEGMLGARRTAGAGSFAVLETETVAANVRAVERALKATNVELVEIRLGDQGLAGKGVSILRGELHDVEAAVALATAELAEVGSELSTQIVSAPHDRLGQLLGAGTTFASGPVLELDGESS